MKPLLAIILIVIVALLIWFAVGATRNDDTVNNTVGNAANSVQNTISNTVEDEQRQVVTLATQNNSGQSGIVTLTAKGDQTEVRIQMSGSTPQNVPQPAHIHVQNCANIGAVKYPLTNVVNGTSTTTINAKFADIFGMLPLSINVHKSAAESSVYVACGDLRPL